MTASPDLLQEADANQGRASEPDASAWVSANAGTGKTAVLVKRMLRLLLAGVRPESILCLTYTKTAAAEMQNRLLKALSGWALMSDADLRGTLLGLMGHTPTNGDCQTARRLFARVLEARGGLKIYTIHGFCERLLQRFPLEAAVTPHFTVLDEQSAGRYKADAFDAVMIGAASGPQSPLGGALAKIVALTSEDQFREIVGKVLAKRADLARIVSCHGDAPDWTAAETEALRDFLGVAGRNEDALIAAQAAVLSDTQMDEVLAAFADFASKAATDKKMQSILRDARTRTGDARLAVLRALFYNTDGTLRKRLFTKDLSVPAPGIATMLDEAKRTFDEIETDLAHLRVAEASGAVLAFADAIENRYADRKRQEAALDYEDLIAKTLNVLSRSDAAAWILYKIDGGVDHILVDEAQDTNPDQWSIVETLAEEFFAGHGAQHGSQDLPRTLFAVGDEKQSIYSFQGANPTRFCEIGRKFRTRAGDADASWHDVPLNISFRSTVPILEAVDYVFAQDDAAQGLSFLDGAIIEHFAFRQGEAGLVELWDVETTESPSPTSAFEPWAEDMSGANALNTVCLRIASQIRHWLDSGEPLQSKGRPIRAGDVLILVRQRDPFTAPMIRALKRANIPVAGADRMRLMEQIAVQDLIALADVLLMRDDDLALAVVLKSPLFGLGEEALFDLAYDREGSLWSALQARAKPDARFEEAASCLSAWLGQADTLPPYEFYTRILGDGSLRMRKRMLSRLGPEAAEAIDEFLDTALAYDRDATPSLQGFVNTLRQGDADVKRDMDQDRNEVRIMTVHGAKGLQAPIVIMPDTCTVPRARGQQIYSAPRQDGVPDDARHLFWPPAGHSGVPGLQDAKASVARRDGEEYRRLLYVAMTRAEDRLYVCGWQGVRSRSGDCWYELIRRGLEPHLRPVEDHDGRPVYRMSCEQEKPLREAAPVPRARNISPLPAWSSAPAPQERVRTRLSPSRLALNASGEGPLQQVQPPLGPLALAEDMRFVRGRLVHALLQYLPRVPPSERAHAAGTFVAARASELLEHIRGEIAKEALAIVGDDRFAPLFAPDSLAEVPVVARVGTGREGFDLEGQIDRLAILDEGLLILDYKTNRPPPEREEDVAPAYIGQLAAYRLALQDVFPGKPVRAALLWTDGPRLMEISSTLLDEAEHEMLISCTTLTA